MFSSFFLSMELFSANFYNFLSFSVMENILFIQRLLSIRSFFTFPFAFNLTFGIKILTWLKSLGGFSLRLMYEWQLVVHGTHQWAVCRITVATPQIKNRQSVKEQKKEGKILACVWIWTDKQWNVMYKNTCVSVQIGCTKNGIAVKKKEKVKTEKYKHHNLSRKENSTQ